VLPRLDERDVAEVSDRQEAVDCEDALDHGQQDLEEEVFACCRGSTNAT